MVQVKKVPRREVLRLKESFDECTIAIQHQLLISSLPRVEDRSRNLCPPLLLVSSTAAARPVMLISSQRVLLVLFPLFSSMFPSAVLVSFSRLVPRLTSITVIYFSQGTLGAIGPRGDVGFPGADVSKFCYQSLYRGL